MLESLNHVTLLRAQLDGGPPELAERLQGRLLLLHGTSDDDVSFGDTVRLMDALNRAGRPYGVVIFPEGNHALDGPYWWQRVTGYLKKHLR